MVDPCTRVMSEHWMATGCPRFPPASAPRLRAWHRCEYQIRCPRLQPSALFDVSALIHRSARNLAQNSISAVAARGLAAMLPASHTTPFAQGACIPFEAFPTLCPAGFPQSIVVYVTARHVTSLPHPRGMLGKGGGRGEEVSINRQASLVLPHAHVSLQRLARQPICRVEQDSF